MIPPFFERRSDAKMPEEGRVRQGGGHGTIDGMRLCETTIHETVNAVQDGGLRRERPLSPRPCPAGRGDPAA